MFREKVHSNDISGLDSSSPKRTKKVLGARSSIFDPLRIDPVKLSFIQWHSTSSLHQVLAQTDLYNPRYRNFSTDNLKQVVIIHIPHPVIGIH